MIDPATLDGLRAATATLPSLRLLVLHGSRSRGEARAGSDWDFAFLADAPFDRDALREALSLALGTDAIDAADLRRAGALLRFRVARDGIAIVERPPGAFRAFQEEAALFWCDVEPVLRRAWGDVLAGLRA